VLWSRRYKVAYRARKSLWVKDMRTGNSATIWDVFGFYQAPFVRAIIDNLGAQDPRLDRIRAGKAMRGTFTAANIDTMRPYTADELSALVDLCRHLWRALIGANLKIRRWDGAGAVAAALLDRERIKKHLAATPMEVHLAALMAYFGGRIETIRYGRHVGTLHHADLRSAYPAEAAELPSLSHGTWHHSRTSPSERFAVLRVRWDFQRLGDRRAVLPFPFRSSRSAIFFPRRGETWVWRPEFEAAMRQDDLARRILLLDSWEFREDDPRLRPFAFLRAIFEERKKLKDAKNAAEKALKLGSNSTYGKLAQNIGGTPEHPPPYHQLEYAGWITSAVRAKIFATAISTGNSVVTLATDGIYSTDPLPGLVDTPVLGGWELATHEAMTIAQSGVYWLRNSRKNPDGCDKCDGPVGKAPFGCVKCVSSTCGWTNLVSHYRGFDEGTLTPDKVLRAWEHRRTKVPVTSTRFVTMGRASASAKAWPTWRHWVKERRVLDITATGKREDRKGYRGRPADGLVPTDPSDPGERVSTPYELKFAAERGEESADAQEQVSL